jgi:hypothetical protein
MQQRAFGDVGNMRTAGQIGTATGLAGAGGMGSLGMAGQMANAGNNYYGMATNPYATQAFMNPYLQSALNPMLDESRRQYGITGQQQQGNATRAGAFGGSREALMASENNRNMNTAMNQMIGQGYNTAFDQAQKNIQYGAGLGLQGQQGALQGYGQANQAAGILGQLGQTEFGQKQAINTAQQQVGAVQQAQAQQNLDQRYQDFLKQQNYPYQQLAFMSDMTRGLPLSQSAMQQYTAPPSMVSQLGGLGMAGLGIYGASGGFKAKGGAIKEHSYAGGGKINLKSEEELRAIITNPSSNPIEVASAEEQLMLRNRIQNNPQAREGLGSIATGDMVPEGEPVMAGGGIIAFKKGDKVEAKPSASEELQARIASASEELWKGNPFQKSEALAAQSAADAAANRERTPYDILTSVGVNTMAGTSPYAMVNFGQGAQGGYKTAKEAQAAQDAAAKFAQQQQVEQEKAEFARKSGMLNNMQTSYGQMINKELGLKQIEATKAASAQSHADAVNQRDRASASQAFGNMYVKEMTALQKAQALTPLELQKTPEELSAVASALAYQQLPGEYKKYYPELAPAAAVKPGVAPVAELAASPVAKAQQTLPEKIHANLGMKKLTAQETQAMQWANDPANAKDPRSAIIKQRLQLGS